MRGQPFFGESKEDGIIFIPGKSVGDIAVYYWEPLFRGLRGAEANPLVRGELGVNEETTLVILKPDALRRKLAGEIISRFERRGLELVAAKMIRFTAELCRVHYAHLVKEDFFPRIVEYMTSGPCLVMILKGQRAVAVVRRMVGATDPLEAATGTIRGDLALSYRQNLVHASGSPEEAAVETTRFFTSEEINGVRLMPAGGS